MRIKRKKRKMKTERKIMKKKKKSMVIKRTRRKIRESTQTQFINSKGRG